MLFGHLAVSVLQHRYLKADLVPVVVAGIFPDVVDKTTCYVLDLAPSGRMMGHTLLGLALTTSLVGLIWGRQTAWSWAIGYLGHLVGDAGSFIPWFYPFKDYDFPPPPPGLWYIVRRVFSSPAEVGFELALSTWAACTVDWEALKIQVTKRRLAAGARRGE